MGCPAGGCWAGAVGAFSNTEPLPPVGNVVREKPWEVWRSIEAAHRRTAILDCRKTCLSACIYKRDMKEKGELYVKVFLGTPQSSRQPAGAV